MRDAGKVITVNGPIDADRLGVTLTHEHLLIDMGKYFEPHEDPAVAAELDGPLSIEMLGVMKHNYRANRDNQYLDSPELALREALRFKAREGGAICDLTTNGIRVADHAKHLRWLSRVSGLHVVFGAGAYVRLFHPDWVTTDTIDQLADRFVREVEEGIGTEQVRAGVIGEIGLSAGLDPAATYDGIDPQEEKVLRAAGRAHLQTGAAIVVHQVDLDFVIPHLALDVLEEEGVRPDRVVIAHAGDRPQLEPLYRAMRRGATLAFDNIGFEYYFKAYEFPSDGELARRVARIVEAGFADHLVLSHDVCKKHHLRRFGGYGYDHILVDFRPMLERLGVNEKAFETMMVDNPRRLLPLGL